MKMESCGVMNGQRDENRNLQSRRNKNADRDAIEKREIIGNYR